MEYEVMESNYSRLEDDEILIRRIYPSSESNATIVPLPNGGCRAASSQFSTRNDEEHLSCSRIKLTTPRRLLDDLEHDNIDPTGWLICRFLVSDVLELGLEIEFTPTDRDPGHCSISSVGGLTYPKKAGKKLSKRSRILTLEQVNDPSLIS